MKTLTSYFHGVSEPTNPGPSATAYLVVNETACLVAEASRRIGWTSNSEAQYRALIDLIRELLRRQPGHVRIFGHAKAVIHQISGEWACNHPNLQELRDECRNLLGRLPSYELAWIPKSENLRADAAARQALGQITGKETDMIQIGGLWKKRGKDGKSYLSGTFGSANLMIFENKFKKNDRHPDYVLCLAEKTRNGRGSDRGQSGEQTPASGGDDIPF